MNKNLKWLLLSIAGWLMLYGILQAATKFGWIEFHFKPWFYIGLVLTILFFGIADRKSTRVPSPIKKIRWGTVDNPVGLGPVTTTVITVALALLTVGPLAGLITWIVNWSGAIDGIATIIRWPAEWLGLNTEAWLKSWILKGTIFSFLTIGLIWTFMADPRIRGPQQPVRKAKVRRNGNETEVGDATKQMLPVPVNFGAIPLWLGSRFKRFYFKEGALYVPWWLGFSVSTAPVSETKIEIHDARGRPIGEENLGHFRPEEVLGYVFIGKRTMEEESQVQASDLVEVTVNANAVIRVTNPIKWQAADNPYGTIFGRLEASLRMAVARFHAEDANAVRSLLPSLLLGSTLLYIKAHRPAGEFVKGDLIRSRAEERIVRKIPPEIAYEEDEEIRKEKLQEEKRAFLEKANSTADPDCKPEGGIFTDDMILELEVSREYLKELYDYGGKKEHMAIKDISLPKSIQDAATVVVRERRERVAEVIQARTAEEVAGIHKKSLDDHGDKAAEMAMIDREKATAVYGYGENPIAQAIAGFTKKKGDKNNE